MALDRQEYPAMVAALQPSHAVEVLNDRVRLVAHVNTSIADWLQERRRIEDQYAMSLRKLSRRAAIADPQDLGIFATPWSALLSNLDTLADTHANLAAKIEADVEQPLRSYNSSNREMTSMGNMQGNLNAMAKDIDSAQKKADKAGAKKAANANSDLDNAKAQWESQAPFVFESLQALDESRLNHLRDVLTQLQTHEVDKIERSRVAAEQCLNVLLTIETADEIKTFALRTSSSEPRPARPQALQSSASAMTLPPSTPSADDRASNRSDSVSELPTPKADKPRGLRRLGTVLSRRRESKIPAGAGRISESPERTPDRKSRLPNSATFSSFGRSMGRSRDNMHSLEPPREDEAERPRSPLRTVSSRSETVRTEERPTTNGTHETSEAPAGVPNGSHQNDLAGLTLSEPIRQPSEAGVSTTASDAAQSSAERTKSRDLDPITAAEQEAAAQEASNPAFKVAIKDAPAVQEAGDAEALTNMATTLKMQAPSAAGSRRQGTVRGRRDNRASVYDSSPLTLNLPSRIAEASIQEQPSTIPESPAHTAAAAVPVVSPQPAITSPFGQGPPFPAVSGIGSAPQSPLYAPRPPSAHRDDTGSVRSGRSHSSIASASHRHPELTAPGLNTSIIETVSATFEQGKLTRSVVIGEVALTNNSDASSAESETIRLSNFSALDKVAPNPAFLVNSGNEGTYALNLVQLGRGKPQVAFRYQLASGGTASSSLVPVVLHPQWKIEPAQTSVIVAYSLNPNFNLGGQESVTLKDVTLMLHLGEGSKATSCLSKPVGTFNKERGIIYWSLGELTLRKSDSPQRLLARFTTEGEGRQGKAEARWIIEDANINVGSEAAIELKRGEDDPFSDAEVEKWIPLESDHARKRLVAGSYAGS
ncbi:hypothetical protein K461DRAFT_274308 [Myriangium duriaei CBS 260.36]|uniref:MHD domain-containing protein n=1 Tax=Myriangium duriaei CBS 260.36 TaxID=1168546 RepID=A0A9P4JEE0_9PEZI|nr:hypothetical protein K461DRAFT_274308 [Myriangium duriaei CBS 260.36]